MGFFYLIVFFGLLGTYAAAATFFIEYFNRISIVLLCIGAATILLGITACFFVDYAKEHMPE